MQTWNSTDVVDKNNKIERILNEIITQYEIMITGFKINEI